MVLVFNYVKCFCHFFNRKFSKNKIINKQPQKRWKKPLFFDEKRCLKFKGKIVEKLMVLWYNIEV